MSLVLAAPAVAQWAAPPLGTVGRAATRALPATFVGFSRHIRGGPSFPTLRQSSLNHPSPRRPSSPTHCASCPSTSGKREESEAGSSILTDQHCLSAGHRHIPHLPHMSLDGRQILKYCICDRICYVYVERSRSVKSCLHMIASH